jgi:hypothetical protein
MNGSSINVEGILGSCASTRRARVVWFFYTIDPILFGKTPAKFSMVWRFVLMSEREQDG